MRNLKTTLGLLILISTLFTTLANAAAVKSMSRETAQDRDGARYWEIAVQCSSTRESRVIEREDKSNKWCLQGAPSNCFSQKINAARKACSGRYKDLIAAESDQKPTKTAPEVKQPVQEKPEPVIDSPAKPSVDIDRDALLSEKIAIERELIQIRQKKIELRQRELELKQLELKN